MSDNIPFEIQVEIIRWLPVKSLIQFRSVSKTWKSLIDSSQFITDYSTQQSHPQHLLVSYRVPYVGYLMEHNYISIVDDNTFPQQKDSVTIPVNWLKYCNIIGYSHGLFCLECLYGKGRGVRRSPTFKAVLWNISIRKAVVVVVPNVGKGIYITNLGFGVCRETNDIKIVKITYINRWKRDMESVAYIPWQVEVFTLSTGAWRSPYCSKLPRKTIQFGRGVEAINGVLYWLATDLIVVDGRSNSYNLIISFDMTGEEFIEVNLPDSLAHQSYFNLSISKLRGSLVVLERGEDRKNPVCVVWMMEDEVPNLFTKLFTISTHEYAIVKGFRNSGESIIEIIENFDFSGIRRLVAYEPLSKHIYNLGIDGKHAFYVHPYMETLLLLDQQHLRVYNDILKQRPKNKRLLKHTSNVIQDDPQIS